MRRRHENIHILPHYLLSRISKEIFDVCIAGDDDTFAIDSNRGALVCKLIDETNKSYAITISNFGHRKFNRKNTPILVLSFYRTILSNNFCNTSLQEVLDV